MVETEDFGRRVFRAHLHLEARLGRRVGQAEFAKLVADRLGDGEEPVSQTTVGRWIKGSVPSLATLAAIAAVCGVDPGWLTFGPDSAAPAPGNPATDQATPLPPPDKGKGKRRRR